jgi:hypothetical protein
MRVAIRIALGLAILFLFANGRADTIYRCEQDGALTFSDRPCGTDAQTYEPDVSRVSEYKPVPTKAAAHAQRRTETHTRSEPSITETQAKHAAECRRIHDSLGAVRDKMRAGYNAKQGERLKERARKLNESRREKRC